MMMARERSSYTRWWKAVSVVALAVGLVFVWNAWKGGSPPSSSNEGVDRQSARTARAQQANRNLAELRLRDVRVAASGTASDDTTVTFIYENTGADTDHAFALYVYDFDIVPDAMGFTHSRKRSVVVPSLGRDQTGEIAVTYRSVEQGTYQACAVIDVWDEVAEQEEGLESNRRCTEVRVDSGQQPTPATYVPRESSIPRSVRTLERFQATIVLSNTSTMSWTPSTHLLRNLDYSSRATASTPRFLWGISSAELPRGARLAPGALARFELSARAPSAAGLYQFRWQLVQERVDGAEEPFGDVVDVPIAVSDEDVALPPPPPSPLEPVDISPEDNVFPTIPPLLPSVNDDRLLADIRYSITPMPSALGVIARGKHVDATAIVKLEEGASQSIRLTAVDSRGDSVVKLHRDLLAQLTAEGELITLRVEVSNTTSSGEHAITVTGDPGGVTATWQFTVEGATEDQPLPPLAPVPLEESALSPLAPSSPPSPPESPELPAMIPSLRLQLQPEKRVSQAPEPKISVQQRVSKEPTPLPTEAPRETPSGNPPRVLIRLDPSASAARLLYAGPQGSPQPLTLTRYNIEPRGESVELRAVTVRVTRNINVVRSVTLMVNDRRFGPPNGVSLDKDGRAVIRQQPPAVLRVGTVSTLSIGVLLNRASEVLSGRSFEIGVLTENKGGKRAVMDVVGVESALSPVWINDRADHRGSIALGPTYTVFDGIPMLKRDNGFNPSSTAHPLHTVLRFYIAALGSDITIANMEVSLNGSCRKGGEAGARLMNTVTGQEYALWPEGTDWMGVATLSVLGGRQSARGWRLPLTISSGAFQTLDLQVDTSRCEKGETLSARLGGRAVTRSGLVWKDPEQGRLIDVSLDPVLPIIGPTITFR